MQTYSLVILDIDGTLLNSEHQIMPRTRQILNRLEKRGVPIVLCSARSPGGVEAVERQAGLQSPIVCYSGGLVLDTGRSILGDTGIPSDTAVSFKRFALEHFREVVVSAYLYDVWLVDDAGHPAVQREAEISRCTPLAGELHSAVQAMSHVHKLLCIGEPQQIMRLQSAAAKAFPQLTLVRSSASYLEVMPRNSSKQAALEQLRKYYRLDRDRVVAFGDHFVDLEMLRCAGLGVAMGNAPEEVKQAADQVTASNDEEGVYMVLRHLKFEPCR